MDLTLLSFKVHSERLPSQMREDVPTGVVLVGAWGGWFREHRGLHLVPTLDIQDAPPAGRPQAN